MAEGSRLQQSAGKRRQVWLPLRLKTPYPSSYPYRKINRLDRPELTCGASDPVAGNGLKSLIAYFGERDHGFRLNVISESGGR